VRNDLIGDQACSIARSAAVVGDPWSLLIVRDAFLGHRRFAEFVEFTGAQPSVVSDRLKRLVASGVLERRRYQDHPPREEYRLTAMGRDLQPVLLAMTRWGDRHLATNGGPPVVHTHLDCGGPADPITVCGHCGEPLTVGNVVAEPGPGADVGNLERRAEVLRARKGST
jgi:DNA-binding HxlR family transcriptional regulator